MSLVERLQAELKTAMRDHDDVRRDALRMALSAAAYAEKQARRPLTEDEMIAVLAREVKTRRESVEAFRQAGRADLADAEARKLALIADLLPPALSEDELGSMVRDAIAETGASSPKDLGRVMAVLSPRTKGRADGRAVSAMVARELARSTAESSTGGG